MADNLGDYSGVTESKRDVPLIVSLTSSEERFDDLVISLYSLLNQSVKPDKIILWLSDEYESSQNLPYEITRFVKNGLEIRFVKDIKSYTKIIYALKEFSSAIIVTAEDSVYYPKKWLEKLYYSYIAKPNDIHVHEAHRVSVQNGDIAPYESWKKNVEDENARYDNFLVGVGGILYPPDCFTSEVFRKDIFLKYAPHADEVWLWFMALLSNRRIRVVSNHIKTLTVTNFMREIGVCGGRQLYTPNRLGANDRQIQNLLKFYGRNIMQKLDKISND